MQNITGILSYPHLFTARAVNPGDDPKFSVVILIPKGDPQIAVIEAEIEVAKAKKFPLGFPANGKSALKDCAIENPDDPSLAGYMALRTNSNPDKRPPVVDLNRKTVIDPSKVFPGVMAEVCVAIVGYKMKVNSGIGAYVNGVMILGEEGPLGRLDNSKTVDQMFGAAGAPAAAPTAAPGAPAVAPAAPGAVPPPPGTPAAAPPPPAAPVHQMLPAAGAVTYEAYIASGWTDEQLIANGYMAPPGGVAPAYQ